MFICLIFSGMTDAGLLKTGLFFQEELFETPLRLFIGKFVYKIFLKLLLVFKNI